MLLLEVDELVLNISLILEDHLVSDSVLESYIANKK